MANSFLKLLMSIPLVLGGHELGHMKAGREAGIPVRFKDGNVVSQDPDFTKAKIKVKNGKLVYDMPHKDPEGVARMFGGGFQGQDLAIDLLNEFGMDNKMPRMVSGINKIGYAMFPKGIKGVVGDVDNIGKVKGEKAKDLAQMALVISGLSDILKSQGKGLDSNKDLSFWMSDTGAPGLKYTQRF